uniref:Uncharacterized protein n=1 Tax=Ornithorhynchus anatinus TaxID=9258 RepID=A0A6I8NT72_ORNAN
MAAVRPGHHDLVHHLQRPVLVPVLLPAVHPHQGRTLLHHRNLPDSCRAMRDERSDHLHGQASRVAGARRVQLRLRLHPGLDLLPAGPHQRRHLHHPEEAGVSRLPPPPPTSAAAAGSPREKPGEGGWRPRNPPEDPPKPQVPPRPPRQAKTRVTVSIEDVYSIYGFNRTYL